MLAIELVRGGHDSTPNPELTAAVNKHCHGEGLVTLTAGTYGNVLRFLPPLTISDELLHEGLDILEQAIAAHA
jgi:4-aminobutyrate aminotransferase/(S)-3-amino-2-methylpropionate transaminase